MQKMQAIGRGKGGKGLGKGGKRRFISRMVNIQRSTKPTNRGNFVNKLVVL